MNQTTSSGSQDPSEASATEQTGAPQAAVQAERLSGPGSLIDRIIPAGLAQDPDSRLARASSSAARRADPR